MSRDGACFRCFKPGLHSWYILEWIPWNYRETLTRLARPTAAKVECRSEAVRTNGPSGTKSNNVFGHPEDERNAILGFTAERSL